MRVSDRLRDTLRDRDVLETESSIRVFERAWGWVKVVDGIATALLAIVGGGIWWKVSDLRKAVDNAEQLVNNTAVFTQTQIGFFFDQSLAGIRNATEQAKTASAQASAEAAHQTASLTKTASETRTQLKKEGESVGV
jgi:hypothetical protein